MSDIKDTPQEVQAKTYKDHPVDDLNNKVVNNDGNNENSNQQPTDNITAQPFEPATDDEFDFNVTGDPIDNGEEFRIEEDRFTRAKPVWNDVKFAIFFLIMFLSFTITSMVFIIKHFDEYINESPIPSTLPNSVFFEFRTILLLIFISLISFGVSLLIFILAGRNSAKFTIIGLKVITGLLILGSVSGFFIGQFIQSIFFAAIAIGIIVVLLKFNPLISLASTILNIVTTVLKKYPSTAGAALIGFFSSILFFGILGVSVGCIYLAYGFHSNGTPKFDQDGNITSQLTPGLIFTMVFINFAGLYIIDVLKNVMHVTIGGIYGTWYYLESTFEGMPNNEGKGSFKRAMTYSFGSVCMGSLYVASFQAIAIFFILNSNGLFGMLGSLTMRTLGFGVGYFNLYAYSYVALYGVGMIKSAKSTKSFFKQRGVQALLNDSIISLSMGFYCIAASIIGVLVTYLYLVIFRRFIGLTDDAFFPLLTYSFMVTINITTVLITTVVSGSSVFFFALNKDPAVYQESNPFEFQEISRCYPKVLTKLQLDN